MPAITLGQKLLLCQMKRISAVIIAIFFINSTLQAQDFSYVQFTEKDGLPSDIVYDLCQDKKGFIWFATENGVCRYDGTHFKTYTTADGLPDNAILKVYSSADGTIWVTPFMYCPYYLSDGRFYPIEVPAEDLPKLTNVIQYMDIDSNLVVQVERGTKALYYLIHENRVKNVGEVYENLPQGAYISSYGKNLVAALNYDSVFYKKGKRFFFSGIRTPGSLVTGIDNKGNFRDVKLEIENIYTPSSTLLNGKFLFATRSDSIFLFNKTDGKLHARLGLRKASNGIVDMEDGLWMATIGHGVFRYPSLAFRHSVYNKNDPGLYSIAVYDNKVITGDGRSGLLDAGNGRMWADYGSYIRLSGNTPAQVSGDNRVYKLHSYKNVLYTGTDAFLVRREGNSNIAVGYYYPVKDIYADGERLLVCLGVNALLLNSKTLKVMDTVIHQRTTAGVIDGDYYYLGTIGGLVKVKAGTKVIEKLDHLNPALAQRITAISRTSGDTIWVLTSGAGMLALKNDRVVSHLTKSNGLSSDICTSIFPDGDVLWVGTDRGISKLTFNGHGYSVIQFTRADGLASNAVYAVSADSNMVYVVGPLGLNSFSKAYIKEKSQCLFHLLAASANNKALSLDSVYRFNHDILNIRFDFVGISYKSAGEISYYYRLEGLDRKWNYTTNTFINFPSLQPGRYTLSLKAVNKFGVESAVKKIYIVITPPWWKTWWFISLLAVLLAGMGFYLYQRRIRKIIKEEKDKQQLQAQFAALEQQALQAQMNPHFIFNCLNSIQSFVIKQDVEGANRYLSGFASLIRQTLDNSSEDLISLADEIKYLETYLMLEKARLEDKFVYEVKVLTRTDTHAFLLPAMLLQPYVENALRHGIQHRQDNNGEVKVVFSDLRNGKLLCRITDNGLGREKTQELKSKQHIEYMSKGTAITEKRITMLKLQYGKEIAVRSLDIINQRGEVCGTAIELEFPDFSGITGTT